MILHLPRATTRMPARRAVALPSLTLVAALATVTLSAPRPLHAQEPVDVATIERIKAEEMNHSQIMDLMSWLSDVYGPRLTWSPNLSQRSSCTFASPHVRICVIAQSAARDKLGDQVRRGP